MWALSRRLVDTIPSPATLGHSESLLRHLLLFQLVLLLYGGVHCCVEKTTTAATAPRQRAGFLYFFPFIPMTETVPTDDAQAAVPDGDGFGPPDLSLLELRGQRGSFRLASAATFQTTPNGQPSSDVQLEPGATIHIVTEYPEDGRFLLWHVEGRRALLASMFAAETARVRRS